MIPHFHTPWGELPSFGVFCSVGILFFVLCLHIGLRDCACRSKEEAYILPKAVCAGFAGFGCSALYDALFKLAEYGRFRPAGIAFYGGMIGAVVCISILICLTAKKTSFDLGQWLNRLTVPFLLFHIWGRLGCFFAGCCYGKQTESRFGVVFPDNVPNGIIHNGVRRYPTQLFEVAALIAICLLVRRTRKRFLWYLLCYSVARFLIEFFRGDDRGAAFFSLSAAQWTSLIIFLAAAGAAGALQIRKTYART